MPCSSFLDPAGDSACPNLSLGVMLVKSCQLDVHNDEHRLERSAMELETQDSACTLTFCPLFGPAGSLSQTL